MVEHNDRPRNAEEIVDQAVNEIEEKEELTEINHGDDDLGGSSDGFDDSGFEDDEMIESEPEEI